MDDRESRGDSAYGRRTGRGRALMISIAVLIVAVVGFCALTREKDKRGHERELRICQAYMDAQIAAVKAGEAKSIYLYCSVGTDALLERLRDVPGVEELNLHLTDVSDAGLEPLTALPRLKRLVVCGGRPGVSDAGFARITSLQSLECLKLVNTHITDTSLPSLKKLPKLQTLVLYHDAFREATFTDRGLNHLKALTRLKRLELTGGWASASAVNELVKAMPDCTIDATSAPDADE